MAGTFVSDTIQNGAGATVPTTTVISGSAKAWVNYNGTGTPAINNSFNVSSVTRASIGNYTVNFTTAMPNANYILSGTTTTATQSWIAPITLTTTSCSLYSLYAAAGTDGNPVMVVFHGS